MDNVGKLIFKRLEFIVQRLKQKNNKNLYALDLGCGDGYWSKKLQEFGFIVDAVDKNKDILNNLKNNKNINIYCTDVLNFKFPKKYYDVVICLNLLHLLNENNRTFIIKKIYNTTKFGGTAFLLFKQNINNPILISDFWIFDIIFCKNFFLNNEWYIFLELKKPKFSHKLKKIIEFFLK
jgi:2-polyprenyl-3-methyl-5-hydroxy-6-metoxy-1,4-benzoquinol methylase